MLGQEDACFLRSRDTHRSVHKAMLSGALLEAVRWWNRSADAFPPLSVTFAWESGPAVVYCNAASMPAH